jgi:AbrB family looped-hinge helix DNA binding protein
MSAGPSDVTGICGFFEKSPIWDSSNLERGFGWRPGLRLDVKTRMSTRGQVVIPVEIRRRLGLASGQALQVALDETERAIVLRMAYDGRRATSLLERSIEWERTRDSDPVEELLRSRKRARIRERARRRP